MTRGGGMGHVPDTPSVSSPIVSAFVELSGTT